MFKTLTSLQHPLVKHLVKLRKNSDYRHEHQSVVIEGIKLVNEVSEQFPPKIVMAANEKFVPKGVPEEHVIIATDEILKKVSGMLSSEGVLAEVPMPPNADMKGKRFVVAVDGVSDPGNVGNILRTALALGWEGVFILKDSCDPFNEKVIRSARGATFRLPMAIGNWEDLQSLINQNQWRPFAADIDGKDLKNVQTNGSALLVLGNEAHGLSEQALKKCEKVTIPMPGPMESLNVAMAGGILMYMLKNR